MKFLANENSPLAAVLALKEHGYDILWVRTECPGISDQEVLVRAKEDDRIIITFDKDFGELAFRTDLPLSCGIILFRISPRSPSFVANLAVAVLSNRTDWAGHFSVVEESRIRMTRLPREES